MEVLRLVDHAKRGGCDMQTMVQIHRQISSLKNREIRESLNLAWQQSAFKLFSLIYPASKNGCEH
jgi:hypothetical protein